MHALFRFYAASHHAAREQLSRSSAAQRKFAESHRVPQEDKNVEAFILEDSVCTSELCEVRCPLCPAWWPCAHHIGCRCFSYSFRGVCGHLHLHDEEVKPDKTLRKKKPVEDPDSCAVDAKRARLSPIRGEDSQEQKEKVHQVENKCTPECQNFPLVTRLSQRIDDLEAAMAESEEALIAASGMDGDLRRTLKYREQFKRACELLNSAKDLPRANLGYANSYRDMAYAINLMIDHIMGRTDRLELQLAQRPPGYIPRYQETVKGKRAKVDGLPRKKRNPRKFQEIEPKGPVRHLFDKCKDEDVSTLEWGRLASMTETVMKEAILDLGQTEIAAAMKKWKAARAAWDCDSCHSFSMDLFNSDMVQCTKCSKWLHKRCTSGWRKSLTGKNPFGKAWACAKCQ